MGIRHADRIWMIGGAAVVALLVVASWFLLISPKRTEISDVQGQTGDAQLQLIALRKNIAALEAKKAQLPALTAALKKKRLALPSDSGVPNFLRQLQSSGTATSVDVTGISVSAPVQMANLPAVWALPITLTATGTIKQLESFLNTLQTGQSRAVLIEKASVSPDASTETGASKSSGNMSLSLSLNAFVAPATGSGAPSVTTK